MKTNKLKPGKYFCKYTNQFYWLLGYWSNEARGILLKNEKGHIIKCREHDKPWLQWAGEE
jgi:hypothetical protein